MTVTRNPIECPACGRVNDRFSAPDDPDSAPEDGDSSICFGCAEFLTFVVRDGILTQRLSTPEEINLMLEHAGPDTTKAIDLLRAMRGKA